MFKKQFSQQKKGAALIIVIFFFIAISIAILQSTTVGALSELRLYRTFTTSKFSYVATEAAIEDLIYRETNNLNVPWSGFTISLNGAIATATKNGYWDPVSQSQFIDNYSKGSANSQMRNIFTQVRQGTSATIFYLMSIDQGGIRMGANSHIGGNTTSPGIFTGGTVVGTSGATIDVDILSTAGSADPTAQSTSKSVAQTVGNPATNAIVAAQSFTVPGSGSRTLTKVGLDMKRVGIPGNAVVRIVADVGGVPGSTTLASTTLNYSFLYTSGDFFIGLPFLNPPVLTAGNTYWIVLDPVGGSSATNYWVWMRSSSDAYTGGAAMYSNVFPGGSWASMTPIPTDMAFQTYFDQSLGMIDTMVVNGQAIAEVIKNSTINGSARYQLLSNSVVTGTSGTFTGYQFTFPFAASQITTTQNDATAGGVITGDCGTGGASGCNTFPLALGPKKIVGNLTVNAGETLTLTGTVYVTGNITVNGGTINCHSGFVNKSCGLVADGYVSVTNNARISGSGGTGSYLYLISNIANCKGPAIPAVGCATNQSGIFVDGGAVVGTDALLIVPASEVYVGSTGTISSTNAYGLEMAPNAQVSLFYPPLGPDGERKNTLISPTATTSTGLWTPTRWGEF